LRQHPIEFGESVLVREPHALAGAAGSRLRSANFATSNLFETGQVELFCELKRRLLKMRQRQIAIADVYTDVFCMVPFSFLVSG
jgi:hypothetical protein